MARKKVTAEMRSNRDVWKSRRHVAMDPNALG